MELYEQRLNRIYKESKHYVTVIAEGGLIGD